MNNNELRSFTAHQAGGWATPILYERAESSPHLTRGLNVSLFMRPRMLRRAKQAVGLLRAGVAYESLRISARIGCLRQGNNQHLTAKKVFGIGKGLGG